MRVILAVTREAVRRRHGPGDVLREVTGLAIEIAVRAGQRILRPRIVIETPLPPAIGIVAEPAIRAETAFMMLVAVAAGAFKRSFLEFRRSVTPFASDARVTADQRKARDVVIKGLGAAPGDLGMTLLAVATKRAFVAIVLAMAGNARRRQLVAVEISDMAGVALDLGMRAPQGIFRVLVVIEANRIPLCFAVACRTAVAIASGMDVLDQVAARAFGANPLVSLSAMAGQA